MTRQQKIDSGKLWQVHPDGDADCILYEGSRAKCMQFIRVNCLTAWKKGEVRLGKVVWERNK